MCKCMQDIFAKLGEDAPQSRLAMLLSKCYSGLACPASKRVFSDIAARTAMHIDSRVETWGNFTWQKTAAASSRATKSGRRCVVGYHVKRHMLYADGLHGAVPSDLARTTECVGQSLAAAITDKELCNMQASAMLSFHNPFAIGMTWDAARHGKPAKETLLTVVEELEKSRVAALPPADFGVIWETRPAKKSPFSLVRTTGTPGRPGSHQRKWGVSRWSPKYHFFEEYYIFAPQNRFR